AQALQARGHEVAFATGQGFGPVVKHVGFQHFPCGLDYDGSGDVFPTLPEWPDIQSQPLPPALQQLYGFIAALGPRMADDLIPLVESWQPALIVRDQLEFGSYIVAERFSLPYASVMWALYIDPRYGCAEALVELRQRYGLPDSSNLAAFDRYLVLKSLPPEWNSVGAPEAPVTHSFCTPPFDQSQTDQLPAWVETLPARPTIHATLGTAFNQAPDVFRAIIAALSTEDVNVIITVGRSLNPALFHPLPDNIYVEQYIPQSLLLPRCAALIFHGGYNSLLSALWHGLPLVTIPMGAGDQLPTAQQCQKIGLGPMITDDPLKPETIRAAVLAVLTQPQYREQARHWQSQIKALPDLSIAAKRLETLAENHEPQFV
ncbi:MAG TPA: glycosyltransferase, partial [Phototrophicaceae bacterium]|nr:glycosyltransferase [Phototrophicaceae bacterium]